MFVRRFAAFALLAACTAAPVLAQDASQAPAAKPAHEKKVCRYEKPTGSNLPEATCHTKSEWAQIDTAQQAYSEEMRHSVMSGGSQGH